jgi:hypothetical protein
MPSKDFLPAKDAELLAWSANYSDQMLALGAAVGIQPAQQTAYAALHADFAAKLQTATEPSTRTRSSISLKNDSRTLLKAEARELARIINAFPNTTNAQRLDLGLNARSDEPTPINPPTEPPVLEVLAAMGRTLKIRLRGIGSEGRGKPEGVDGATVMSFVGTAPPADVMAWTFQGSTTRTTFDVEFPPTVPAGAQVWLTAFWFNPRSQSGPACAPVSAYLAGGVTGSQAA